MTDSQKWLVLVITLLVFGLISLLTPVLLPFVISAILAYLGDPLVDRLEMIHIKNWRLGRTLAVILVFLIIILSLIIVLLIIIPGLESQVSLFFGKLPNYIQWLNQTLLPWIQQALDMEIKPFHSRELVEVLKQHWQKAGGILGEVIGSVSQSSAVVAQWLMNIFLIPVITFYLLRDWDILVAEIHDLIPRRYVSTIVKLARDSDRVLAAFFRGQFYVMLALGVIYSIGLAMTGLELALLIGIVSGMISFVPYLGAITGIVLACLAAIVQFQDVIYLIPVMAVFAVGQALESTVLTPVLVGDQVGLHPVAVIFAILAGGQLFGFMGVLLALPVAAVIMVILRHIHELYRDSDFYSHSQKQ